jgi:hypothetical protein
MTKLPLLVFVVLSAYSCAEKKAPENRQIQVDKRQNQNPSEDLFDWLGSNSNEQIKYKTVFAVTPNDCNSCMELFTQVMRYQLANPNSENQLCVVFQGIRQIERKAIIQAAFQDTDTTNIPIIWSDIIFSQAHELAPTVKGGSLLLVFDKNNKLLYSKAGKSVTGTEPELRNIFN